MINEIAKILMQIPEGNLEKFAQFINKSALNRIWIIGNGGSSSTASHFAADLSSLGFNTTCPSDNIARLTAIANDYGWSETFIKQLHPMKRGDVLIPISVHGGSDDWSDNLVSASIFAKGRGASVLSLTGFNGGRIAKESDLNINVPAERTYIIEGIHCVLTHIIRQKIEEMNQK